MAFMQRTRVLMDSDLDDDTTWRRRIDLAGSVTAIEIRIDADREADRTVAQAVHTLADCISRIELLKDATTPLISLTGEQIDAMNYWDNGRPNARRYLNYDDAANQLSLFLLGGRSFYDREYGFDFDKLNKVYLEYTYDLQEGVADYFEADTHDIELYAWQWKGASVPKFKGYLRSRQLDAWTTTAENAEHTVEIPASNPIRRVGFQSKTRARTIGSCVSKLELAVDKGAYSPVIIPNIMKWCQNEVTEYDLHNVLSGVDHAIASVVSDLPYWFSYYEGVQVIPYVSDVTSLSVQGLVTAPARVYPYNAVPCRFTFDLRGWGFQKCLRIGFDHEHDGFDLLRVPSGKALDLICTEANADRAVAVFFQDVINY